MPTAMPLTGALSQDCKRRVKQRLKSAGFGDGYFQTAADGINSIVEEWDLVWSDISLAERNTVIAALLTAGTDHLTWTPPGDGFSKKYQIIPDKYSQLYDESSTGLLYTISTSVIQVR